MLVLSRKTDEELVIELGGQQVMVRVVAITRNQVRLGITAPREVSVLRKELVEHPATEGSPETGLRCTV